MTRPRTPLPHQTARKTVMSRDQPLAYCLDDLLHPSHPCTQSVVMGFTADGHNLVSYCARMPTGMTDDSEYDIEYDIELWAFDPPRHLQRTLRLPIFNCKEGGQFGATEVFDRVPVSVSVAESSRTGVLCVVGTGSRELDHEGRELDQDEEVSARRYSVSCIIGVDTSPTPVPPAVLLLHLTYLASPPYPAVQVCV